MPGVSTGAGNNAFDARVNGGLQSGDEASVDGVSMQQGFMSQGGMVSILQDFPMSPDMVSQIKVLSSGYAPEYGSSTGGQIMAVTKSGGSRFHGAAFESHQDASLKAIQWGKEKTEFNKQQLRREHRRPDPGSRPHDRQVEELLLLRLSSGTGRRAAPRSRRCRFRRLLERQGDFRDWRDPSGNLIPIYDPATLRPDGKGGYIKDQFMGCDGKTPNVICPGRINPLVAPWLAALPHADERRAAQQLPRAADPRHDSRRQRLLHGPRRRADRATTTCSRASGTSGRRRSSIRSCRRRSRTETYSDPQNSWVNRFNYDKILTSTLVNHMSAGYLNRNEGYGCVNQDFVGEFPQIAGVAGNNVPPQMSPCDEFDAARVQRRRQPAGTSPRARPSS